MLLTSLPLLRLCATVPFPGTPAFTTTIPEPLAPAPSRVAIAWAGAFDGAGVPAVGAVASVLSVEGGVLRCEAVERCTLETTGAVECGLPLVDVQPLTDAAEPAEASGCAALHDELRVALEELAAVNEDLQLWPPLLAAATPSAFSLALAGTVALEPRAQQRLLESTSTVARLEELKELVEATRSYYAAQASLRRLGSMFG